MCTINLFIMFNIFNALFYYVSVNIEGMDLQQTLLYKNIVVYGLCTDIQLLVHKCFQKHMDLDIDSQYKLDGFCSQCLKRILGDIQPWALR